MDNRFNYEWQKYKRMFPEYEEGLFLNWVFPLRPEDFKGKKVLDAGCGNGRNAYWLKKWGAQVTAFDYNKEITEIAEKNAKVPVFVADIHDFSSSHHDIAVCIGVLNFLENPRKAIIHLMKHADMLVAWVYAKDDGGMVRYITGAVRALHMPIGVLHFFTYFASIPFWIAMKTITLKGNGWRVYFNRRSHYSFPFIHQIIFDQFLPEHANYWSEKDIRDLFRGYDVSIIKNQENGWNIIAR